MKHILITLIIAGVASANSLPPCPYNTYNTLPPTPGNTLPPSWELTGDSDLTITYTIND